MWFLLLWFMGLIAALVHFVVVGVPVSLNELCKSILFYQFVVTFGLIGVIGVIVNVVYAKKTALKLGWPSGPFQIKYGFSQLTVGVMGIMTIWFKGSFWVGTLITMYLYGLSGLWSHTQLMIKNKRIDIGNIGNLVMDICYQAFITWLSIYAGGVWH